MEILDGYCLDKVGSLFADLKDECRKMRELEKELSESDMDDNARMREQELLEFEIGEITDANITPGEDEELETAYRKMTGSRKITEALGTASLLTGYGESSEGALDLIGRAVREVSSVSGLDKEIEGLLSQLSDVENLLSDFNHGVSGYLKDLEFDDEYFREVEDRLNVINHLKDKYGQSLLLVIKALQQKEARLEVLTDLEAHRKAIESELNESRSRALLLCKKISDIRKKAAGELSKKLKDALVDLNFLDVKFEIEVRSDEEQMTEKGYDDVEFMISTNPGEDMRPLDQIASGGELSRIMLALKTVVADKDDISTLIFDEIDAGISGKTAWKVSEKLGELSRDHQIICITHLPQIAAMADNHFMIEKGLADGRTETRIYGLKEDESIRELSRLLGGEEITDAAITNAREMRKMAQDAKKG
jgi:DNA repair protein RecN (Recombination protein N)